MPTLDQPIFSVSESDFDSVDLVDPINDTTDFLPEELPEELPEDDSVETSEKNRIMEQWVQKMKLAIRSEKAALLRIPSVREYVKVAVFDIGRPSKNRRVTPFHVILSIANIVHSTNGDDSVPSLKPVRLLSIEAWTHMRQIAANDTSDRMRQWAERLAEFSVVFDGFFAFFSKTAYRIAKIIAGKYRMTTADTIGATSIAILTACEKHKGRVSFFERYVFILTAALIKKDLRAENFSFLSPKQWRLRIKMLEKSDEFFSEFGRRGKAWEIASWAGLKETDVEIALTSSVSLNAPVHNFDGDTAEIMSLISAQDDSDISRECDQAFLLLKFEEILASPSMRDLLLKLHFPFHDTPEDGKFSPPNAALYDLVRFRLQTVANCTN